MPRPNRHIEAGALHHVMNRGVNGQLLFRDEHDYRTFLRILRTAKTRFDFLIHVFCLMPNHFHLLMEMGLATISEAMLWIETTYAVYFNDRYRRYGRVYQGRFKSPTIGTDAHYRSVVRYIDMNPVRAGLVSHPRQWPWSSHREIVAGRSDVAEPARVLARFGDSTAESLAAYLNYVEDQIQADLEAFAISRDLFDVGEFALMDPAAAASSRRLLDQLRARFPGPMRGQAKDQFVCETQRLGFSVPEVAEFLGVTRKTIYESMNRLGRMAAEK